ncbi:MAG: hypothetical protein HQ516_06610 [Chlorobium sp.]|nr:hypothetical protein [Chlorobium phaeovibrioides]NQU46702.1 hypothetical protein [Chlorobium sp.]
MKFSVSLPAAVGVIVGASFTGVSLWLFFTVGSGTSSTAEEIRVFSALTGAYGLWRIVKSVMQLKKGTLKFLKKQYH